MSIATRGVLSIGAMHMDRYSQNVRQLLVSSFSGHYWCYDIIGHQLTGITAGNRVTYLKKCDVIQIHVRKMLTRTARDDNIIR